MGKSYQGIHGNWSGKVGNVVGRMRNNRTILAIYQPEVANPQTPAQMANRARFSLVSNFISVVLSAVKIGFNELKGLGSAFSAAVKENFTDLVTGSYPSLTLDAAKAVVSKGTLDNAYAMSATVDAGEVEVTWSDNSGIGNALATDNVNIVIYNEDLNQAVFDLKSLLRETRTASISLPSAWDGDKIYIYAFASRSGMVSDTLFLGQFTA